MDKANDQRGGKKEVANIKRERNNICMDLCAPYSDFCRCRCHVVREDFCRQ